MQGAEQLVQIGRATLLEQSIGGEFIQAHAKNFLGFTAHQHLHHPASSKPPLPSIFCFLAHSCNTTQGFTNKQRLSVARSHPELSTKIIRTDITVTTRWSIGFTKVFKNSLLAALPAVTKLHYFIQLLPVPALFFLQSFPVDIQFAYSHIGALEPRSFHPLAGYIKALQISTTC